MHRFRAESLVDYLEDLRSFLADLESGSTAVDKAPEKPTSVSGNRYEVDRVTLNSYALMSDTWDKYRPVYALAQELHDRALKNYVLHQCMRGFSDDQPRMKESDNV